jgi:hypothetical protein
MSNQIDVPDKNKTTADCYSIEHLLESLNDRRRYLEDLWQQRKVKLDQCLQICYLKEQIQKVFFPGLEFQKKVNSAIFNRQSNGFSLKVQNI